MSENQTPPVDEPEQIAKSRTRADSLLIVNTGNGKGKSTAAFGIVMRAVARDWRVCVMQFIKSDKWKVGEEKVSRSLGVEWLKGGDGFTWESDDLDTTQRIAVASWQVVKAAIASGDYDLVVLDEVTYPMNWGWIDTVDVVDAIAKRPRHVNIVATGRDAPESLLALADTVTEMVNVRHAFDQGVKARRGIDF
jgi:cob(I)alamin adenosyltransferase